MAGHTWAELQAQYRDEPRRWIEALADPVDEAGPPQGETGRAFHGRVQNWLNGLPHSGAVIAFTHAGPLLADLFVSTTGTDADFIVKLIDVYPNDVPPADKLGGYQQLVRGEPFRGKFRNSFEKPEPFTPGGGYDPAAVRELGAVGSVAQPLFNEYLLAFELTSVLLLVALVGAVIIGRRRATA